MKLALILVLIVGGCVALIGVYALTLPEARQGTATAVIAAAPDRIIAAIEDVERQVDWRPRIRAITLDDAGWTEELHSGETIRFAWRDRSPSQLALQFSSSAGYSGDWVARLDPHPSGTEITVVEEARIPNPLTRLIARLVFDPDSFATDYLAGLKSHVEGIR